MKPVLITIILAQFLCTSLWFAGNAVIVDIAAALNTNPAFLANQTSFIQGGFIMGTLLFAVFSISDRYSPSKVFFWSAIVAALFNIGICIKDISAEAILMLRFFTGFFLAGIYPVGMKIAADYFETGLGKSLGFLVGALVLGTAFPHFLRNYSSSFPYQYVIIATSGFSIIGGTCILLFVPDGPYRKGTSSIRFNAFIESFKIQEFRTAAFGYFGHMWELYSFWAFVPIMIAMHNRLHPIASLNIAFWSFIIIAAGSLACIAGGFLAEIIGTKKMATIALFISCACCMVSPLILTTSYTSIFIGFLLLWSLSVIADSPLFSTLVAKNAPASNRGSSITIVNSIGFAITIISIQSIQLLSSTIGEQYIYTLLAIGPILGLRELIKNKSNKKE